jgi:hypothetical protein
MWHFVTSYIVTGVLEGAIGSFFKVEKYSTDTGRGRTHGGQPIVLLIHISAPFSLSANSQ